MKTLQNNFTTPEQSKRLLELGLPVKSADCYYCIINATIQQGIEVICDSDIFFDINTYLKDFFPCWSVGRLMEICDICILAGGGKRGEFCFDLNKMYIQNMIDTIQGMLKLKLIDFSKLDA